MAEANNYTQDNRVGRLHTELGKDKLLLLRMTCVERLSEPFTIVVDCMSPDPQTVHALLGTSVSVEFDASSREQASRWFNGNLWEYAELESDGQGFHYRLILRPESTLLSLNRQNRIYQNKTVPEIVNSVLTVQKDSKVSGSYDQLDYCVQYQESDLDFVSRLLEFEGIYYYHVHAEGRNTITLIDSSNAHPALKGGPVPVYPRHDAPDIACIWSVVEQRAVGPTRYTVDDYDFERPSTDLKQSRGAVHNLGLPPIRRGVAGEPSGGDWVGHAEIYDFPAKYAIGAKDTGMRHSEQWLDAHRRAMSRSHAEGSVFAAACGSTFHILFDDRGTDAEYLITGATHRYSSPSYHSATGSERESFSVELELMPADEQFRPAMRTPRPRILGPQTAVVVGPAGEEIWTDKYGRIKVQFHWDRFGKNDENSSCFIRVAQMVAGSKWGSFYLPRIGQEVIIEFLDGDPDRPICTGAVYNAANMPPADSVVAQKEWMGLKTRSSRGGGGFNHHIFVDKKGDEAVYFRAEKFYGVFINAGDEKRIYEMGNRTVRFVSGNDFLDIQSGGRKVFIKKDDDLWIKEGSRSEQIDKGDDTLNILEGGRGARIKKDDNLILQEGSKLSEIDQGDEQMTIKMGSRTTTLNLGSDSLTLNVGNQTIKLDVGKQSVDALSGIELKSGPSKLTIDPSGITLEGLMITVDAKIMLQTKGLFIQQEADAMHIVKGGIVMIN